MEPLTVAAVDEQIAALVAKKKAIADEIKKARKNRARRVREAKAAEAEKRRKERTHNLCQVAGMLVRLVQDGDQDLYQYLIKKIEPHDQELACIWADLPYEGKEPKGVLEAIASGTSLWTDEDAKEMQAIREVAAAHPDRRYLTLPDYGEPDFDAEKDAVKSLGAKYDPENKAWYIPAADLPAREKEFAQWL